MIVTIANAKGGVAKTTTAVYLCAAHGLAVDGMEDAVLLDADVQASASLWRDMAGDAGVDLGFDVMPANLSTLRRLRGSGVDRSHGLTVVDAPPQGAVLEAAVAAADFVVVPASDSPLDLQQAWATVAAVPDRIRPRCWSCAPSPARPPAGTRSRRWTRPARPGSTRSCANGRTSNGAWARAR